MFKNSYNGKKVLVTGHTGFKGAWLSAWLIHLGAEVIGISDKVPTKPSLFEELSLEQKIDHKFIDVRDSKKIASVIKEVKPNYIFHLAAQPIVSISYSDPVETISSNVIGTMSILDALKDADWNCSTVLITSDKCYDNIEQIWGYKETDTLGGKDIYSGSKGAAELIIKSYYHSFFNKKDHPVKLAIGRAGNVIGGGDWAQDRIVVDCYKSWNNGEKVEIRSPDATRPWQHVLEPLSGYLTLGSSLRNNKLLWGEAFNFGPNPNQNTTVLDLLKNLSLTWGHKNHEEAYEITDNIPFYEAGLLKLNCDKALFNLKWESTLNYHQTIEFVGEWYRSYYQDYKQDQTKHNIYELTSQQISRYESIGKEQMRVWTK